MKNKAGYIQIGGISVGLFSLFTKKDNKTVATPARGSGYKYADSSTISEDERQFYQPDSYYTLFSYPGTTMEERVVTFDERKKTSYPSSNGLYVAEILLLEYCSYGKYPKPSSGYPGFWWFEYGIRDVGHALESLYQRGFLKWEPKSNAVRDLKVDDLKQILQNAGLPVAGKKSDLVDRILTMLPESQWVGPSYIPKYELTQLGQTELEQNGYVVYMHKHPHKTTEDNQFGPTFTVWDINKLFPHGNASNWRTVVGKLEEERYGVNVANAKTSKSLTPKNEGNTAAEKMRDYLNSKKTLIAAEIKKGGDGFKEEAKGLDYFRAGKDKEALVQFYISIGKDLDAPALYSTAAKLLLKYGMNKEAIQVLDAGLKNVAQNNWHRKELIEMKQKLKK